MRLILIVALLAAFVLNVHADQQQEARVTSPSPAPFGWFGTDVDIHEDTAIVGAPNDLNGPDKTGAAYVFLCGASGWVLQASLFGDNPNDAFGQSVAIDKDLAVVGAPGFDGPGTARGAVYVFERSGSAWSQQASYVGASDSDRLGFSVDVVSAFDLSPGQSDLIDFVHAGAPGSAPAVGHSVVIERAGSSGAWPAGVTTTLFPAQGCPGDQFGTSLSAFNALLAVGSPRYDDNCANPNDDQGATYVFGRPGGTWGNEVRIQASDRQAGDRFGGAVSMYGRVIAVGASAKDNTASLPDAGAAYVFRGAGTANPPVSWDEEYSVLGSEAGARLGGSVVTDLDRFSASAPEKDGSGGQPDSGEVRLYSYDPGPQSWTFDETVEPSTPVAGSRFGGSIELDKTTDLIVGASLENAGGQAQGGAAYTFLSSFPPPLTYCVPSGSCQNAVFTSPASNYSIQQDPSYVVEVTGAWIPQAGIQNCVAAWSLNGSVPPFGAGFCMAIPILRGPLVEQAPQLGGQCTGTLLYDMVPAFSGQAVGAGCRVNAQLWWRDASPGTFALSDALRFYVTP